MAVVEAFDVIEDLCPSLSSAVELPSVNQFEFESAPEAFHESVVIAVGFPAHGGAQPGFGQSTAVMAAGILDTAVGVQQQADWWFAVQERHGQSIHDQRRIDVLAHGPANDLA